MERSDNTARQFFIILGAVLLVSGVILLVVSLWMNMRMDNSRQVSAKVTEVIETNGWHRKRRGKHYTKMYTSVYEYYDDGELKTYTSSVSTSNRAEIGSEATLYISVDGKIYERSGTLVTLIVGIGFSAVGGFFTFISVIMWRKISAVTEE